MNVSHSDLAERICFPVIIILMMTILIPSCSDGNDTVKDGTRFDPASSFHGIPDSLINYCIEPKDGSSMEKWIFHYDDYTFTADNGNGVREVYCVLTKSEIYIQGLSAQYPDAWIKGSVKGRKVTFENAQLVAECIHNGEKGQLYFTPSSFKEEYYAGHTFSETDFSSKPTSSAMHYILNTEKSRLEIDVTQSYPNAKGFVFSNKIDGSLYDRKGYSYAIEGSEIETENGREYVETENYSRWEYVGLEMYPNTWFERSF